MVTSTSALPGTTILNLPIALTLDGDEWVPIVQGGTTKRAQTAEISEASTGGTVPYVMASSNSGFAGARALKATSPITLTDGGPGGDLTIASTTITVPSGGTGVTTLNPYAVVVGGTVSSGPVQQVSNTSAINGWVLTYVSSIALPVWNVVPGSLTNTTVTVGASYNSVATDQRILVNKAAGSATAILLAAAANYAAPVLVKDLRGDASSNPITVTFTGGELFDGLASVTINAAYGYYWFNPLSTRWYDAAY